MSRRPPYWALPALALLLLAPAPWFQLGLLALVTWRVARTVLARRGRRTRIPDGQRPLGYSPRGRPVTLSDRQLAAHGLVVGASGSGKSTTLLRLLTDGVATGAPVVAIDLKGSPAFTRTLAAAAARAGRPFVVWSLEGDAHWNPLAHGNPTELKDKLISTERFTEPHYQRAAERYLQLALTVLAAARPGQPPRLDEVVALSDPRRLSALLRHVADPLRTEVHDYLARLTPDQLSAVRGLGTRLAVLTESHTGRFLAPGPPGAQTVDLRAALAGDAVVVLSLNSSRYGKLAAQLGSLAVQDLTAAAGARLVAGASKPALVAIDEFSALGADHVLALLARGREAGLSVLLATQELADLERAARGFGDQVLGNTAVKVIHRQDVPASALMAARLAGTEKVWEVTQHFGGRGGGLGPRGTRRLAEQFIVHPNEFMRLGTGGAVLITKLAPAGVRRVLVAAPEIGPAPPPAAPALSPAARQRRDWVAAAAGRGPQRLAHPRRTNARAAPPGQPRSRPLRGRRGERGGPERE